MLASEFAKYAHALRYSALPPDVVTKAKTCILDLLGCAVSGFGTPNARVALRGARSTGGRGKASVWMTTERLRAIDAVLPNSVASHCALQDDWLQVSHSHVGAVVVPTALALAEELGRGGRDVLAAVVAAYDVEDRAGTLSVPAFTRGYRVSSLYGYFGAATVAARLMRLSRPRFESALACAGSLCGGILQSWIDGSMEWSFQEGFGARGGILAASLAANGLVGSGAVLDGSHGVNRCFSGTTEGQGAALEGLGTHHRILDTCFKRFATGGANQGSAAVARALYETHRPDPALIRRVRVAIPRNGSHERMNYAGIGFRGPYTSTDQCLISKPFAIAAVLMTGALSLDTVRRLRTKPRLLALAQAVELREVDGLEGWDLEMCVEMADGTVHRGTGADIDRSHLHLSWDGAAEKFRALAGPRLGPRRTEQVIALVGRLETLDSIAPVTRCLASARAA